MISEFYAVLEKSIDRFCDCKNVKCSARYILYSYLDFSSSKGKAFAFHAKNAGLNPLKCNKLTLFILIALTHKYKMVRFDHNYAWYYVEVK